MRHQILDKISRDGVVRLLSEVDDLLSGATTVDLKSKKKHRGIESLTAQINGSLRRGLKPPPRLTLSQWADRYAYLSPENSAEPGKWNTIPYQRGMMDAVTDDTVVRITIKKSARVGYTKIIDHVAGYYTHQDPSPIMIVQPTVEDAKGYSTDEIEPMIRDTPVLDRIAIDVKEKGSGVTQLKKKFTTGGSIALIGANAPRGFRRVTIRVMVFDEVDGYPVEGAGKEGDQIALGIKRTETFWNRKIIEGSTPLTKGASRICRDFELSDKRFFFIACPHCDHKHILEWKNLKWPKDDPEAAYFVCPQNGCVIEEHQKAFMIADADRRNQEGEEGIGWVATAQFRGHAGFFIWAAYSLFPNASWGNLAREFYDINKNNNIQALQVFTNTVLGEPWEEVGERIDDSILYERREDYDRAPWGVGVVTAGVDVQADRLEIERVGFGLNNEMWGLGKTILYGDPSGDAIWKELDSELKRPTIHESGVELSLTAVGIDSGFLTQQVGKFCNPRWDRKIWAIKGQPGPKKPIWPNKPSLGKGGFKFWNVGVDNVKDTLYARLKTPLPGPNFCHFNMDYDEDHFTQLTSEERVSSFERGQPVNRWQLKPGAKRNEALDIRVYAMAVLEGLILMRLEIPVFLKNIEDRAGKATGESKPTPKRRRRSSSTFIRR